VENRQRDVNSDGSKITYVINGNTLTRTFNKDTTGYYSYDVDSVDGVVTDVDEYDWAVPGNGIVIWHIDQNVIDAKIAANKINTDKYIRGVDVEEADGIQDIGEQFTTVFGDVVIGEGGPEDFWYRGNDAELYKNKFSKDTRPPAVTNYGANSLITMSGFSDLSNKMNFQITYGDSVIKPVFSRDLNISGDYYNLSGIQKYFTFGLRTDSSLHILNSDGTETLPNRPNFSDYKIASFTTSDTLHVIGAKAEFLNDFIYDGGGGEVIEQNTGNLITAAPVIRFLPDPQILAGTINGKILRQ
jgi:hypothetical protein